MENQKKSSAENIANIENFDSNSGFSFFNSNTRRNNISGRSGSNRSNFSGIGHSELDELINEIYDLEHANEPTTVDQQNESSVHESIRHTDIHNNETERDDTTTEHEYRESLLRDYLQQSATRNKRINSERTGRSTIDSLSKQEFVQKIKREFTKNRLVHDIIDARRLETYHNTLQELTRINILTDNSFLIAIYHPKPNFEHFHLIHNCNFSNTCRCFFMQKFSTKRRTDKSTKTLYEIQNDYINNLVDYLIQDGYIILKILFGSANFEIRIENDGKLFNILIIFFEY